MVLLALLAVVMFTGLMLIALLIGLSLALVVAWIVVPLHEWLRLRRDEAGLLSEVRKAIVVVAVFRGRFSLHPRLWLVLSELLLRSRDQTEIMFGMLVVILGGDRVAGGARVTRQLYVFFCDV